MVAGFPGKVDQGRCRSFSSRQAPSAWFSLHPRAANAEFLFFAIFGKRLVKRYELHAVIGHLVFHISRLSSERVPIPTTQEKWRPKSTLEAPSKINCCFPKTERRYNFTLNSKPRDTEYFNQQHRDCRPFK